MTKKILRSVALLALLAGGIRAVIQAQGCSTSAKDSEAVVQALRTMYVAATTDDLALFQSATSAKFYAFDNGVRFDGDALMTLIKGAHAKGMVYVWSVTEPEVHVTCNEAWIAYINRGSVKTGDAAPTPLTWLESAVLKREAGVWKIQFFSSMRAAGPAKP